MPKKQQDLKIQTVPISKLNPAPYNPRRWSAEAINRLKESIQKFGVVDPIIANNAPGREQMGIGGHFRLKVARDIGIASLPVIYVAIPEIEREKELNLRLNKSLGEWDMELLKEFDETVLADIGLYQRRVRWTTRRVRDCVVRNIRKASMGELQKRQKQALSAHRLH